MGLNEFEQWLESLGYQFSTVTDSASWSMGLALQEPVAEIFADRIEWNLPREQAESLMQDTSAWADLARRMTVTSSADEPVSQMRIPCDLNLMDEMRHVADFLAAGLVTAFRMGEKVFYFPDAMTPLKSFAGTQDQQSWYESLATLTTSALAQNFAGKLAADDGRIDAAAAFFRVACELCPRFAEPYSNLGTLLWQQGHRAEAFHMFSEALHRHPYSQAIQDNFIQAGLDLADFEKMVIVLDQVRREFPRFDELLYLKALLAQSLGRRAEAIMTVQQLLTVQPQHEQARRLLGELEVSA